MTTMDFDARPQEPQRPHRRIHFKMRGEHFECAPVIPDWIGIELANVREEMASSPGEAWRMTQPLVNFFQAAIHPQDRERFLAMLRRPWEPEVREEPPLVHEVPEGGPYPEQPERKLLSPGWEPIKTQELRFLIEWLSEQYAERPTTPPPSSPDGRRTTTGSSGDGSSWPASEGA